MLKVNSYLRVLSMKKLIVLFLLLSVPAFAGQTYNPINSIGSTSATPTGGTTALTIANQLQNIIDVRAYGAKCDCTLDAGHTTASCVTDDTAAFTAASLAASTSKNPTVKVPGYCQVCGATLYRNSVFDGLGNTGAGVVSTPACSSAMFIGENYATLANSNTVYSPGGTVPSWAGFRNIDFYGNKQGGSTAAFAKFFGPGFIFENITGSGAGPVAPNYAMYTECSTTDPSSASSSGIFSMPENSITNVTFRNNAGRDWQNRCHDAKFLNFTSGYAGGSCLDMDTSANYNGGVGSASGVHCYAPTSLTTPRSLAASYSTAFEYQDGYNGSASGTSFRAGAWRGLNVGKSSGTGLALTATFADFGELDLSMDTTSSSGTVLSQATGRLGVGVGEIGGNAQASNTGANISGNNALFTSTIHDFSGTSANCLTYSGSYGFFNNPMFNCTNFVNYTPGAFNAFFWRVFDTASTWVMPTLAASDFAVIQVADNAGAAKALGIKLPAGATATRPGNPVNGMLRYDSTLNVLEGYINSGWRGLMPLFSGETKFTITGCSATTTVGGSDAGTYTSGTTGSCAVIVTINGATGRTAPNGYACYAANQTTPANLITQTNTSTTTATITGTTVTGDIIRFGCRGY